MVSFFISVLFLLCISIFDAAILSNITFLPAIPDFSLLFVIFFSVNNGRLMGEATGFVSGLFLDFLSASPMGLNCLLRSVLGYLSGFLYKMLNPEGFLIPFFLGLFATLVKALLLFIISCFFPSVVPYNFFSLNFLFELLLNSLLTPLVFKFLKRFNNILITVPKEGFRDEH